MKIYVKGKRIFTFKKKGNFTFNEKTKIMYTFLIFILFTFASCSMQKPVSVAHVERIEERVMPVAVGADTIEIVLNVGTRHAVSDDPKGQNRHNIQPVGRTDTACRVPTIESVRSTRALSMTKITTDTTSTLRITLRPDTVFIPYINHIRSDTIVVPDRICKTKLQKTQTANVLLILILIIIFIILFILYLLDNDNTNLFSISDSIMTGNDSTKIYKNAKFVLKGSM
jgi:hypothetical protein